MADDAKPIDADAPVPAVEATAPVAEVAAVEAAPVEVPAVEAPVEAPVAEAAAEPKTVADTPSLLEEAGDAPVKEEAKEAPKEGEAVEAAADGEKPKEEAAKPEGQKAAEAEAAVEAEPEPVTLEPIEWTKTYELPEAIVMDDTLRGRFHETLDAFRADPAQSVQPLIDLHYEAMQNFSQKVFQDQQDTFLKTRETWRKQLAADEEFGGDKWDARRPAIVTTRNDLVSSAEPGSERYAKEWREFNEFCRITGAGDHPVMFRLLNNAASKLQEPGIPGHLGDQKPAPNGRAPGSKRGILYSHPTSPNNRNS